MWSHFITSGHLFQLIGIAGFICYIIGFASLQLGYLDGNSKAYTLWSLAGASLVLTSLIGAFNLASMLIQVSWIIICIVGLIRRSLNRPVRQVKSPENGELIHANTRIRSHSSTTQSRVG